MNPEDERRLMQMIRLQDLVQHGGFILALACFVGAFYSLRGGDVSNAVGYAIAASIFGFGGIALSSYVRRLRKQRFGM